ISVHGEGPRRMLRIELKYVGKKEPVLSGLRRVSRPGLRVYRPASDIPRVFGGLGTTIMSTPKGVMSGRRARRLNVGGEVLAAVWEPSRPAEGGSMSRIGRQPIPLPDKVSVTVAEGNYVTVQGPGGTLSRRLHPRMKIIQDNG